MSGSRRVPVRALHVEVSFLDDEAVLYDTKTARPALLNGTAALVWVALDGHRSVHEIAADLAIQFGADPLQVEIDVAATLASFDELGLLDHIENPLTP